MSQTSNAPATLPQEFRQLRILTIDPGTAYHIRCLSETYSGTFTHFNKKSYICHGSECPSHLHGRFDVVWKGYASVDVWFPPKKIWLPHVLEISEHLELDFRFVWKRGQVWEVFRDPQNSKRVTPVTAKLLEDRDPDKVPPAFDFVPVLLTRYHCRHIDLNHKNPLPPRVFLPVNEGEGPVSLANQEVDNHGSGESFTAKAARLAAEKKKAPSDKPKF